MSRAIVTPCRFAQGRLYYATGCTSKLTKLPSYRKARGQRAGDQKGSSHGLYRITARPGGFINSSSMNTPDAHRALGGSRTELSIRAEAGAHQEFLSHLGGRKVCARLSIRRQRWHTRPGREKARGSVDRENFGMTSECVQTQLVF
jgi:hypothetical protein